MRDRAKLFAMLLPQTQGVAESPVESTNIGGVAREIGLVPLGDAGDMSAGRPAHMDALKDQSGVAVPYWRSAAMEAAAS